MANDVSKLIQFLISKPLSIKILYLLRSLPSPPHTRELLGIIGAFTYGHRLLKQLEDYGLIERRWRKCRHNSEAWCKYIYITSKGEEVLDKLSEFLGSYSLK